MSIATRITAIEEHIGNAYSMLDDLGIDLENVDKNIDNIASVLEDYYDNQPKVSATDVTEATLEGTKVGRLATTVKGNSKQETTNGYNLLKLTDKTSVTPLGLTDFNIQNEEITVKGTTTSGGNIYLNLQSLTLPAGDYTLVAYLSNTVPTNSSQIWLRKQNENITNVDLWGGLKRVKNFTLNETTTILGGTGNSYMYANTGKTFDTKIKLMILSGTYTTDTVPDWEKYTNGASPNPSYEQPISSCGDNINLAQSTLYNTQVNQTGDINVSTNRVSNVNTNSTSSLLLKKGTYTLSIANLDYCSALTKNSNGDILDNFALSWHGLPYTFTLTQDGYLYFTGRKDGNPNINASDYVPKLEQGNQATSYSPNNQGSITEKIFNKNLWSSEWEQGVVNQDGTLSNNNNIIRTKDFIYFEPEQPYAIKRSIYSNYTNVRGFDKNKQFVGTGGDVINLISGTSASNPMQATVSSCVISTKPGIYYLKFNDASNDLTTKYMMVKGNATADYVAHAEQNYSIYTQQPFKAIGTTRDVFVKKSDGKWYERHNIARAVLNGTENWTAAQQQENYYRFYTARPSNASTAQPVLCNIATFKVQYATLDNSIYIGSTNLIFSRIIINNEYITTDTAWKTYLANQYANGNPVYIDYQLSTPNDILCTEQQTTQLEALYKAKSYNGQTNIYTEDNIEAYLDVSALKEVS